MHSLFIDYYHSEQRSNSLLYPVRDWLLPINKENRKSIKLVMILDAIVNLRKVCGYFVCALGNDFTNNFLQPGKKNISII